jgi:hypothetical protein
MLHVNAASLHVGAGTSSGHYYTIGKDDLGFYQASDTIITRLTRRAWTNAGPSVAALVLSKRDTTDLPSGVYNETALTMAQPLGQGQQQAQANSCEDSNVVQLTPPKPAAVNATGDVFVVLGGSEHATQLSLSQCSPSLVVPCRLTNVDSPVLNCDDVDGDKDADNASVDDGIGATASASLELSPFPSKDQPMPASTFDEGDGAVQDEVMVNVGTFSRNEIESWFNVQQRHSSTTHMHYFYCKHGCNFTLHAQEVEEAAATTKFSVFVKPGAPALCPNQATKKQVGLPDAVKRYLDELIVIVNADPGSTKELQEKLQEHFGLGGPYYTELNARVPNLVHQPPGKIDVDFDFKPKQLMDCVTVLRIKARARKGMLAEAPVAKKKLAPQLVSIVHFHTMDARSLISIRT